MRNCILIGLLLTGAAALLAQRDQPRGTAGVFDYYVLSLSWSPQHCSTPAGQRDRDQCGGGRQYNFVVHGLWPQYERSWPQFCDNTRVPRNLAETMLPLMPSLNLIFHEWQKHGTCSGLSQQQYFETIKRARSHIKIPAEYQSPRDALRVKPEAMKAKFVAANPGLKENMFGLNCSGRFLAEVDVCMTKDLNFRACSRDVRDNCQAEFIVQPVR